VRFNFAVQSFNFFLISPVVFGVTRALEEVGAISQALADGMVICSCLAMSVNMVLVLTAKSGGDEAGAIFNAAFGNLVGVFLSPSLILGYLGVASDVNLWEVFYKLAVRVLLPVAFGQLLQRYPPIAAFAKGHKFLLKQGQQYLLIFIIYTVFCATFADDESILTLGEVFVAISVQLCLMCTFMVISWGLFKVLYPDEPTLRVMALFGTTHKSIATGIPLIKSMYEHDPLIAVYTLPILIWHPMQLVVGSFFSPRLVKWVGREQGRLATHDVTPDDSVDEERAVPDSNTAVAGETDEMTATRNSS
jgi:solute carrier family 10 (sodium/bile acid cotransporter), member 7